MALDTGLIGKTWPIITYDIYKEKICDHHPRRGNRDQGRPRGYNPEGYTAKR